MLAGVSQEGYLVIRGLLSTEEVEAAKARLQGTIDCWPHEAPPSVFNAERESPGVPLVDIDPSVLGGTLPTPRARELAVRRVFRLAVHDSHFTSLFSETKFTDLLATAWSTEDISVLQSMALLKPPGTGEKFFHADNAYFRLYPDNVGAYWIALDPVDHSNGAMHVVPKSHHGGVPPHLENVSACNVEAARRDAVAVPLSPGDALLFHGNLLHGTPPNVSVRRRRALQVHYADSFCRPSDRRALEQPPAAAAADSSSGSSSRWSRVVTSPNPVFGPQPTEDDGAGFDCAPTQEGDVCYEPQLWHFRSAELIARGSAQGGRCL
jgi:phytanoyl-CoA hydroxylase